METKVKHPRALAIAKKGEDCLWEMGDYLLELAGPPTGTNASSDKLVEVSAELVALGYEKYSHGFVCRLRNFSHRFPALRRRRGISWSAHEAATTPDILDAVVTAAKAQGKSVSMRFVEHVLQGMDADHKAKRKATQIKAEKAAARAQAQGDTKRAERNKARARKLRGAPQRDPSKRIVPKPEDVPMMIVKAAFSADTSTIRAMIHRMDKDISPHINDLSKVFIVASVEQLLEVAEAIRKLAAKLNRNQSNKRAHLHAVA